MTVFVSVLTLSFKSPSRSSICSYEPSRRLTRDSVVVVATSGFSRVDDILVPAFGENQPQGFKLGRKHRAHVQAWLCAPILFLRRRSSAPTSSAGEGKNHDCTTSSLAPESQLHLLEWRDFDNTPMSGSLGTKSEFQNCPDLLRNWNKSEKMDVGLDARAIMPNHVHGILVLVEAGFKPASTAIVRHGLAESVQICSGIRVSWSRWARDTPATCRWRT